MDRLALKSLAGFLDRLSDPEFRAGEWFFPQDASSGTTQMPYVVLGETAQEFHQAAYEQDWLDTEFNWPEWAGSETATRLRNDPDFLASAGSEDLSRLLTVCIRQDRFCEGALLDAFDSGLILGIVRRAHVILSEEGTG